MSAPLFYNFNKVPQWEGGKGEQAPWSQSVNQGYDTTVGRLNGIRRFSALKKSNGNLCDGNFNFPLFIYDLTIDIAISGATAQSQLTRDFYPHHMILPGFQILGQSYDQESYARLCEFVHWAQRYPLANSGGVTTTYGGNTFKVPLIQLYVQGNVYPHNRGTRNSAHGIHYQGNRGIKPFVGNQTVKGQHQETLCLGYIMSMPREHEVGAYAPTWTMNFMVSTMLAGPYKEQLTVEKEQTDWAALLSIPSVSNFSTKANEQQNKKDLAWVAKNSANVISNPAPSNPSGGPGNAGNGTKWRVTASAEDDPPGASGACRTIQTDGYSELSTNPSLPVANLDFAALGHIPCLTSMIITNPANGKSVTTEKQDVGAGSSFLPVMGLYPGTRAALGLGSGGQYTVDIQLAGGGNLHPVRGTPL